MENLTRHAAYDPQHELLKRYCKQAEHEIAKAPDLSAALRAKERLCADLERECASAIVVTGTRSYLDKIIADRWGKSDDIDQKRDHH